MSAGIHTQKEFTPQTKAAIINSLNFILVNSDLIVFFLNVFIILYKEVFSKIKRLSRIQTINLVFLSKSEDNDLELKGLVDKCIDKHPYRMFIDIILASGQFNFIYSVNEFWLSELILVILNFKSKKDRCDVRYVMALQCQLFKFDTLVNIHKL